MFKRIFIIVFILLSFISNVFAAQQDLAVKNGALPLNINSNFVKLQTMLTEDFYGAPAVTAAEIAALSPTVTTATDYTIGTGSVNEAYGGVIYVTGAATITAPAVAANMDFTVVTIGAIAVSLDVNAADRVILDGTALSDGDKATNRSTSGDTISCHYESTAGFFCWSGSMNATEKHWVDGN